MGQRQNINQQNFMSTENNNTRTVEEQIKSIIKSHDIYYDDPQKKPSYVFFEKYMHEGRRLIELVERINNGAVTYKREDRKEGIFSDHAGGYYKLPRCEFLLHQVKSIEDKLIEWFKENKYSQGDSYSVRVTKKGHWEVSYSNDYPMQHGSGKSHILTEEEFTKAITQQRYDKSITKNK